jgi:hypothetical protein
MNPYLSAVDASVSNNFSCYINSDGGSKIVAYTITIKNMSGTQVYTTNKVTLGTPLYNGETLTVSIPSTSGMVNGNDYVWIPRLYESLASMWVTYGTIQSGSTTTAVVLRKHYNVLSGMYLKIGSETKQINSYDQSTGIAYMASAFSATPTTGVDYTVYTDFVDGDEVYFKARKTPVIAVSNYSATVTKRKMTFTGTYTQANNIGWKYFTWNLYDSNNELVKTSGQINTGEIQYTFDGFVSNANYYIELVVENQDDIVVTTGKKPFTVTYTQTKILTKPATEMLREKNAIKVTWEQPYVNLYTVSGDTSPYYDYLSNEPYVGAKTLNLHDGSVLTYDISNPLGTVLIPYQSTNFLQIRFPVGFQGDIIRQENSSNGDYYTLKYQDGSFIFDINGKYQGAVVIQPPSGTWLIVPQARFNAGVRYLWDDDALWVDDCIFGEQTQDILSDNWWKFVLLPNDIKVTLMDIYHPDAFNSSGLVLPYNTRIYKSYKLNKTDVLYN